MRNLYLALWIISIVACIGFMCYAAKTGDLIPMWICLAFAWIFFIGIKVSNEM